MRRPWVVNITVALFAATVTSVFFLDLCNLIFQCGCDHLWGAQDARCNIHNPTGRHCPWCSFGVAGYSILYSGIVGVQFVLAFRPRRWHWTHRLTAAVAAFPVLGGLLGVLLGRATGYWS